ncbi:MAG: hypothetical protein RL380_5 [Verrucomicrobiota bacterium]|jgi:hypothetical protein
MKKIQILTLLAAATLLAVGCKKETPLEKAVSETKSAAGSIADAAKSAADAAANEAKSLAEKAKEAGQKAVAAATDKGQELIAQAKALVSEGKYQEALTSLNGLSGLSLSESQQKAVDSLKTSIQEAISKKTLTDGANALGK